MSDSTASIDSGDELQFTTAEPAELASSASQQCAFCQQPIIETYFAIGDKIVCPLCKELIEAPPEGSRSGRLFKATCFGIGAGLVGAAIWYAVRYFANLEVGLIAILVGLMVGKAVRRGSGERGGRGYQVLAVIITYCCIAANYMPDILQAVFQAAKARDVAEQKAANDAAEAGLPPEAAAIPQPKPGALQMAGKVAMLLVMVFAFSLAAPFLAGVENAVGLLIIAFALWEAWKFNARLQLQVTGPYHAGRT